MCNGCRFRLHDDGLVIIISRSIASCSHMEYCMLVAGRENVLVTVAFLWLQ
jgi:hypothetical protein